VSASTLVSAAPLRLSPRAAFHSTWGEFLSWCGPHRADELHALELRPFGVLGAAALPIFVGPVVYASVGRDGRCRYVGQSIAVRDRFTGHAAVPGRQDRWDWVLMCALRTDIAHGVLDRAEHVASRICRPLEGNRHPRRR
jgi:hypothetical protein